MATALSLTESEAAVALAALVSFSDDDPSDPEGVVLRKYFRFETAESLQGKLTQAGFAYPSDLFSAQDAIIDTLAAAPEPVRLRALGVAWLLANADGNVDQSEMNLLGTAADRLGVSLAEAREVAESGLPEADESGVDSVARDSAVPERVPELTATQAAIALAFWVGFADDDPSDVEAGVIREHFGYDDAAAFIGLLEESGLTYPDDLPRLKGAIAEAIGGLTREEQLHILAVAHKVAGADGTIDEREIDTIRGYCEELYIGIGEVEQYFKTSLV